jgi:hypothetical protein
LEANGDLVENVKALLDFKAKGRNVTEGGAGYQLREESAHSEALFRAGEDDIAPENCHFGHVNTE